MGFLSKIFSFCECEEDNYLYSWGDKVYYFDGYNVKKLVIINTLSGWSADDWEYYTCKSCIADEDGDFEEFELSQKEIFSTRDEANRFVIQILNQKKNRKNREIEVLDEKIQEFDIQKIDQEPKKLKDGWGIHYYENGDVTIEKTKEAKCAQVLNVDKVDMVRVEQCPKKLKCACHKLKKN